MNGNGKSGEKTLPRPPGGRRFRRRCCITDEPMFIRPDLLGKPLASPWRRFAAILADLILILLLLLGSIVLSNHISNPGLIDEFIDYARERSPAAKAGKAKRLTMKVMTIIHQRNSGVFPEQIGRALESGDREMLDEALGTTDLKISFAFGSGESEYDADNGMLILRDDVTHGAGSFMVSAPIFIAYFTLLTWLTGGRTPGKAMFGIRVIRLDGSKLGLWSSFGRAAGYAASAATAFLGFLESIWHPNRQTIHDRIAGTVVIRTGGKKRGLAGQGPL